MPKGFHSDQVWQAHGRGFQMAVVQPPGTTIYLTGQVAWSPAERLVGPGDILSQTRQCFDNIAALLAEVGGLMEDVVSLTTYYTDRTQLGAIQRVRAEYLAADGAPALTSVMVAGFGHEAFLVELTAIAVIPNKRFKAPD